MQTEEQLTLRDIKAAIPKHCFERSLMTSQLYLFKDLLEIGFIFIINFYFLDQFLYDIHPALWFAVCVVLYSWYQGVMFTAVWVLAHECGHGAFSPYQSVNDFIGYICHTCLYAPYFSWQRSHAVHHLNTNSLQADEVWVPKYIETDSKLKVEQVKQKWSDRSYLSNAGTILNLIMMGIFGWPLYIAVNATSHAPTEEEKKHFMSHFNPNCPIFRKDDYWKVHLSTLGLTLWTAFLVYSVSIAQWYSWGMLLRAYCIPLIVNFFYLTAITFLQHTDEERLSHYDLRQWNWLNGALSTLDRSMGSFLDYKFHYIHRTHVCHHLFSKLPFYNSMEATEAFKPVLGKHYKSDLSSSWHFSLFRTYRDCHVLIPKLISNTQAQEGEYHFFLKHK